MIEEAKKMLVSVKESFDKIQLILIEKKNSKKKIDSDIYNLEMELYRIQGDFRTIEKFLKTTEKENPQAEPVLKEESGV